MNTKNDIITEIYKDNYIKKLSSSFSSVLGSYKEDFEQFMYLTICELPDNKLLDLYEKGELYYYLYYIGKATCFNDRSKFWKEHKERIDIAYSIDNENYTEKQFNETDYE